MCVCVCARVHARVPLLTSSMTLSRKGMVARPSGARARLSWASRARAASLSLASKLSNSRLSWLMACRARCFVSQTASQSVRQAERWSDRQADGQSVSQSVSHIASWLYVRAVCVPLVLDLQAIQLPAELADGLWCWDMCVQKQWDQQCGTGVCVYQSNPGVGASVTR